MAIISGDDQQNFLFGTNGNDSYFGFGEFDLLFASFGNDLLDGGADSAVAIYDDGSFTSGVTINNTAFLRGTVAPFTVDKRGFGTDTLIAIRGFHGTAQDDTIYTDLDADGAYVFDREGNDFIQGFGSDDNIYVLSGPGDDTIIGGGDNYDTVTYRDAATDSYYAGSPRGFGTAPVTVTFTSDTTAVVTDPWGDTDQTTNIERFEGTDLGDTMIGAAGNEWFTGHGGDDNLRAGDGDRDTLEGGEGNDTLDGGDGTRDSAYYDDDPSGVTANLTTGTATDGWGNTDTLIGIERLRGSDFDDVLIGDDGRNTLAGRAGNDLLQGLGDNDYLEGGAGNDTLDGGGGNADAVGYGDDPGGVTVDLEAGTATDGWGDTDTLISIEDIDGSEHADTLRGDAQDNFIGGEAGDDLIEGRDGRDQLRGLEGNDTLNGGAGDQDQVQYDRDAERGGVLGVSVNLQTGVATDGFGDTDTLIGIEQVQATDAADTVIGNSADNYFEAYAGDDNLSGGDGQDTFEPGQGNDTIDGGTAFVEYVGGDLVRYDREHEEGGSSGISVDLAAGTATDTFGSTDTLISIEEVEGSIFDDTILGSGAEEWLAGRDGNDYIDAVGGIENNLNGGAGNDTLIGSDEGGDFFSPGTGADVIEGKGNSPLGGEDHLAYYEEETPSQGITVTFTNETDGTVNDTGGDIDLFTGIEVVEGSQGADQFFGAEGQQEFRGLAGDDFFDGGAGDTDVLNYRWGGDTDLHMAVTVDMVAGTATDQWGDTDTFINIERVQGTQFGDTITGNADRNELRGREGDDLLDSFGGADNSLDGDQGNDTIEARGDGDFAGGGDGNDLITFYGRGGRANPGLGSDTINGGTEGFFSLGYWGVGLDLTIDVEAGTTTFQGSPDVDTFSNIVNIEGGEGNDTLLGNDFERQEFFSSLGDDFIDGRGDGDDGDRDWLIYSINEDEVTAQEAAMAVDFTTGTASGIWAGNDRFVNIEAVRGSHGNDLFIGSDQPYEEFQGMDGVDTIEGGGGQDRINYSFDDNRGGTQGVTVDLAAQTAIDGFGNADVISGIEQVNGSAFTDTLLGSDDDNVLIDGGGGNDTMDGRGGDDFFWMGNDQVYATGGSGADEFGGFIEYLDGDTITDFSAEDRINIFDDNFNELAADATIVGNELRLDIDGDGLADGTIILENGYSGPVNVVGGPLGGPVPTVFSIQGAGQFSSVYQEDTGPDTITITRSGDLTSTATVDVTVAGTGVNPADANDVTIADFGTPFTVTFAPGVLEQRINVGTQADSSIEADEDLSITLSNAVSDGAGGAEIDGAVTFHRILNDDLPASVRIDGQQRSEHAGVIEFTISRSGDVTDALEVPYQITSAGGLQGAEADDLVGGLPQTGSITIPAGAQSVILAVAVAPDTVAEMHDDILATISRGADWPAEIAISGATATGSIRNDDGVPPVLPVGATGSNFGDPHLVTLDGLAYDFQAVGEFTLIEAASGDPLDVQVRFQPVDGSDVASQTTAVATTLGSARVVVDLDAASLVTVDGAAFDVETAIGGIGLGDGDVYYDGEAITFVYANGEQLRVDLGNGFLSTSVSLGQGRDVRGLLGNGDGDTGNDLALRDGTVLAQPVAFDTLYGAFADDWRISDATSLFDYPDGQGTSDFTDPSFPAAGLTLEDFPLEIRVAAEEAAAGITDPVLKNAAILDYLLSGDATFIEAAAGIEAQTEVVAETAPEDAPSLAAGIGVLASVSEIVEGDAGSQEVTFTLYRTGDLSESVAVDYAIDGTVDGADYSGPGAGVLAFAVGQASAAVTVDLLGDTAVEDTETLAFSFTVTDGTPTLLSSIATVAVVNDDLAPVEPEYTVIEGTNGSDQLTGTDGDDLILGLGGRYDRLTGNDGADVFVFGPETQNGQRDRAVITDFEVGADAILLTDGAEIARIRDTNSSTVIFFEGDRDAVYVRGEGVSSDTITILYDDGTIL